MTLLYVNSAKRKTEITHSFTIPAKYLTVAFTTQMRTWSYTAGFTFLLLFCRESIRMTYF